MREAVVVGKKERRGGLACGNQTFFKNEGEYKSEVDRRRRKRKY
jgi:hypothetical protein